MASVLTDHPIALDIKAVRKGLGWAQSWSSGTVLCRIHKERFQLIAVTQKEFLASWSWKLPGITTSAFFLIPPFVAATITNPMSYEAEGLEVMVRKTVAGLIIRQGKQEFRLQWRWDPSTFKAPPFFDQMLQPPTDMMKTPYVAIADVVHLAIANLGNIEGAQDINFDDAAIQIDFSPGQFNVEGKSVTADGNHRYFFDPRLVIRGMEVSRGDQVGFSIEPVASERALLYFTTEREGCHIHCAMLSSLYHSTNMPATTLTIRETRPPMADGAWILPRKK